MSDEQNSRRYTHEIVGGGRHSTTGMLNLNQHVEQTLGKPALALHEDRTTSTMTTSEKVQSLFEQFRLPVFRYVLRKTRDSGRAEDFVQEAFLRLFRHLRDERTLDNPKAWLFTVVSNLAIDATRGDHHTKDLDEATWEKVENAVSGREVDPERQVLQRERLDRMHVAVLNLTPLQRECLHLRAEGLRYREIGELMGLSMSTVIDAVRRATLKLSREFEGEVQS